MSTAKKKTIKFTAFITLFILSISYFSLLSPTSAYFYKEVEKDGEVKFALFNATDDHEKIFDEENALKFKAGTKFADFEEKLFDDVAIIKEVTVTNDANGVPARIFVNVTPDSDSVTNGLKYMTFISKADNVSTVEDGAEETTTPVVLEKGELKKELESVLHATDSSFVEGIEYSAAVSILDEYNKNQKTTSVTLAPGESAKVKFVFWAEYTDIVDKHENWQDASVVESIDYSCRIEIIASQDNDEAAGSIYETTTAETTTVESET